MAVESGLVTVHLTFLFFSAGQNGPLQGVVDDSLFIDDVTRSMSKIVSPSGGEVMFAHQNQQD